MKKVSIKEVQSSFKKAIICTKKMGRADKNGLRLVEMHLFTPKIKTPIKTQFTFKVILFKETLEFKHIINLCYSWQTITLQNRI